MARKRKGLTREEMLTRYAYYVAGTGTTGDTGDMIYVMNGDGIEVTEEEAIFVSTKIHEIYANLRKQGEGWKGLITRKPINRWGVFEGSTDDYWS
jgi:hypothetical protein